MIAEKLSTFLQGEFRYRGRRGLIEIYFVLLGEPNGPASPKLSKLCCKFIGFYNGDPPPVP
ncbi:hypothetical protein C5167_042014 [Papaver somniferum]|nr:hypothetical protein C5167_042014 [Papaver somniferum]